MKQIIFFTFSILFLCHSTSGCSFVPKYFSKFDKTEYIFIGEVVGYTEPVEFKFKNSAFFENKDWFKGDYKQSSGLIVKVKESVYLPKTAKTYFEVFPLWYDSGCTTLGTSQSELKKRFPVNLEILVVAKEASIFSYVLENGNFRLVRGFADSHIVALNVDKNKKQLTDASSIFEYSQLNKNFDFIKNYYLFDFEARKDLLRLQLSKTPKEKEIIVSRLLQNPTRSIDFLELLRLNVKNQPEILSLYEKRLRLENEFYLKLFKKEVYSEEDIQKYLNDAQKKLKSNKITRKK